MLRMAHLRNVTYLTKEELIFEVSVRGLSPEGDVETLRPRLREAVSAGAEVAWQTSFNLGEQLAKCRQKCEDWEGVLESFREDPPTGRDRSRQLARLDHLLARVQLLCSAPGLEGSAIASLMEGAGYLREIQVFLAEARTPSVAQSEPNFGPSTSVTISTEVMDPVTTIFAGVTQGLPVAAVSGLGPVSSPLGVESRSEASRAGLGLPCLTAPLVVGSVAQVSSVPVTTWPGFGSVVTTRMAPIMSTIAAPSTSGPPVTHPVGRNESFCYTKLPNPWAPLVASLQVLDGLNAEALVCFLTIFLRLSDVPGMVSNQLLAIVSPFCRGPLAEQVNMALALGLTIEKFHESVIEVFLPARVREHLSRLKFYRPQGSSEGLGVYVAAVKEARRVLRLPISEADTVSLILEGICPQERSRLVFSGRPSSFAELHQLCITSQSVQFADQQRAVVDQATAASAHGLVRSVVGPELHVTEENRGPICYACGRRGHIRRFCPAGRGSGQGNGWRGGLPPR